MGDKMEQEVKGRAADYDHLAWIRGVDLDLFAKKSLLDLGCGSGFLCELAARQGASRIVGVDLVKPEHAHSGRWNYYSVDLNQRFWPEEICGAEKLQTGFDRIIACDIIEHLDAPVSFLTGCWRLLAPEGILFLTTPNSLSWECLLRPKTWSGAQDPQHRILFTAYSLGFLLERTGFKIKLLRAPIRALGRCSNFLPPIGGQLLCVAERDPSHLEEKNPPLCDFQSPAATFK
jgi:2-polyprenyl-3-methyl-5-hydroxy-6-metoxy-1,4-benzoquinol methylase